MYNMTPHDILAVLAIVCIPAGLFFWLRPSQGTKSATDQGLRMPLSDDDFLGLKTLTTLINAAITGKMHELEISMYTSSNVQTLGFMRMSKLSVMTIDPQNIDSILNTNFSLYSMGHRGEYMGPLLGHHSILTVDGPEWKTRRTTVRTILGRDRLYDLSSLEEQSIKLLASIEAAGPGSEVDIQELFAVLAMQVTTDYLGISDDDDSGNEQLSNALDLAQRMVVGRILAGKALYWVVDSFAFRRACAVCQKKVEKHVERALQWTQSKVNVEHVTIEDGAHQTKVKAKVSEVFASQDSNPNTVRDALIASLVAARDNTAAAFAWTFYPLARNPEVYTRLRTEVLSQFGGNDDEKKELTFDSLKQCAYLQYCMKETLRLEPSVPRSIRHTVEDTMLPRGGGADGSQPLLVKKVSHLLKSASKPQAHTDLCVKGTEVIYSFRALQRSPLHWGADADQYKPERWETAKPGLAYAPFNAGVFRATLFRKSQS